MNPHLRKLLTFVVLFTLLWLGAGVYVLVRGKIEGQARSMILTSGLRNPNLDGLVFELPGGLNIKRINFILPLQALNIPVTLSDSQFRFLWSDLFFFRKAFSGEAVLFSGAGSFRFHQSLIGGPASLTVDFNEIDISQILPLGTFGLTGRSRGALTTELIQRAGNVLEPSTGSFNLNITAINFPGGNLPGVLIPLPKILDGSLALVGKVDNQLPTIQAEASCNLGKFSGEFSDRGLIGDLALTDEGEKHFGGLLVIAAGGKDIRDINDKKHWRISASHDLKSFSVKPKSP